MEKEGEIVEVEAIIPKPKIVRLIPGNFGLKPNLSVYYSQAVKPSTISIFSRLLIEYAGIKSRLVPQESNGRYLCLLISVKEIVRFSEVFSKVKAIDKKAEGYSIRIEKDIIKISAQSQSGLFYGLVTLLHLIRGKKRSLKCCEIFDFPSLNIRGVHLDMKGSFPTVSYLKSIIEVLGFYKINTILLEYEDKIKYDKHPVISHQAALAKDTWYKINRLANDYFINIIPLQQCLGHVEYILKHKEYLQLAENGNIQQFCPSNSKSNMLFQNLVEEIIEVHPECKYFHIGGDETAHLGECPRCKKKCKDKVYLDWINKTANYIISKGIRPIIWDDILRRMNVEKYKSLKDKITLMYWEYSASTGFKNGSYFEKSREYKKANFSVIGASAAKGGASYFSNLDIFEKRMENIRQWSEEAVKHHFEGVISTAWSRFESMLPPCAVFETAWHAVIVSAECFWSGKLKSRYDFNQRFTKDFLGIDTPTLIQAIFDLNCMPISREFPLSSREKAERVIRSYLDKVKFNRCYLDSLLLFSWIERHIWNRTRLFNEIFEVYPRLVNKELSQDFKNQRLRWLIDIKNEIETIKKRLRQLLKPLIVKSEIEEFIEARFSLERQELIRFMKLFK